MTTRIEFESSRYTLIRDRDGAGDSGPMLNAIWHDDEGNVQSEPNVLEVGKHVQCGSPYARSYSAQDWWLTTPVSEIIKQGEEDDIKFVVFKTGNSLYKLEIF